MVEPTKDELAPVHPTGLPAPLIEQAQAYAQNAKASSTWRAYQTSWNQFEEWCVEHNLVSLPAVPETIAVYIASMAERGYKVAYISRTLVALSQRHTMAGHPSPRMSAAVKETLKGIRRTLGIAQTQKQAVLQNDLVSMVVSLPDTLLGKRDRALLLLGFFAALRRSELVALNVGDLEFVHEGLVVHLRKSKTDQEGQGRKIPVPYQSAVMVCPVRTVRAWLDASGIVEGAVFCGTRGPHLTKKRLTGKDIARRVKAGAERAKLDSTRFAGHSLRAGFVTAAAIDGAPERAIAQTTGHKNLEMLRRYIRDTELFREPAAGWIRLKAK